MASTEAVDAIGEVFRSHGVSGVAVEPSLTVGDDEGITTVGDSCRVLAYLPVDGHTDDRERELDKALWHLQAFDLAPISGVHRRLIDEADWATAWKAHFYTFRIGERIVIKPSWRDFAALPDDIVIELDPGMAFGTGLHPTTRMVLEAIEDLIQPGRTVFDVGAGSGILSIAAAKLGASRVLAVDVEDTACQVAAENVELNRVSDVVTVMPGSAGGVSETFDLIVANIIAADIAELAPDLRNRMTTTSILVVSGIIEERDHLVRDAFASNGLQIRETSQDGDWLCHVVRRAT